MKSHYLIPYSRTLNVTSFGADVVLKNKLVDRKWMALEEKRGTPEQLFNPLVLPLPLPSMAAFNPAFRNAASKPKHTEVLPWMDWAGQSWMSSNPDVGGGRKPLWHRICLQKRSIYSKRDHNSNCMQLPNEITNARARTALWQCKYRMLLHHVLIINHSWKQCHWITAKIPTCVTAPATNTRTQPEDVVTSTGPPAACRTTVLGSCSSIAAGISVLSFGFPG